MLFLLKHRWTILAVATTFLLMSGFAAMNELEREHQYSACADAIISNEIDDRAKRCPADIDRAVQTLLLAQEKDVQETKVEYRDRIVPVYNQQQGADSARAAKLEQDLADLQALVDSGNACAVSEPLAIVRQQLCDKNGC